MDHKLVMAFGAFIALVGLGLFIFHRRAVTDHEMELPGVKLKISAPPAIVVFIAGCLIFVSPEIFPAIFTNADAPEKADKEASKNATESANASDTKSEIKIVKPIKTVRQTVPVALPAEVQVAIDRGNASNNAVQYWATSYADWKFQVPPATVWNVDQKISIGESSASNSIALHWQWSGLPGPYSSLWLSHTAGNQYSAAFAVPSALDFKGNNCSNGADGKSGSCNVTLSLLPDNTITFRLQKNHTDPDGQWWYASAYQRGPDGKNVNTDIGLIKLVKEAAAVEPGSLRNSNTYFGGHVDQCKNVPISNVRFSPPSVNSLEAKPPEAYASFDKAVTPPGNKCSLGQESDGAFTVTSLVDQGINIRVGGPK